MSAPTIASITFDSNSKKVRVISSGGNGILYYAIYCNRGTLARNKTGIASSFGGLAGGPGPYPEWTWTDNWPGTGQGPPLYILAIAHDQDGRVGCDYSKFTISDPTNTVYNADATLDWTGGADITATGGAHGGVQGDLNNCPDHRIYRLPANGIGRIDGQVVTNITGTNVTVGLQLINRNDIQIDLNGGTLKNVASGPTNRNILDVVGCTGVVVRNGNMQGDYPTDVYPDIQYPIRSWTSTDGWVAGVTFQNTLGPNVYLSQTTENAPYGPSQRWTLEDIVNTVKTDHQGLAAIHATDVWILRPIIHNTRFNLLDLEQNHSDEYIQRVFLLDPQFGDTQAGFLLANITTELTTDVVVLRARKYAGATFQTLGAQLGNASGPKRQRFYFVNSVSSDQSLSPNGLYNSVNNIQGLFIQSCQQSYHVTGKHAVQLHTNVNQFRLMDSTFTGDTAPYYSDDGTGKDLVQA